MNWVDKPTADDIDRLIAPIVERAGGNLMCLSDPSFEFVPNRMREGISTIHLRLKTELRALLQLRTVYGDMVTCRVVASDYPWLQSELSHYQHLRFAWSQFVRLSAAFDESIREIERLHGETLELLSVDVERRDRCSAGSKVPRPKAADRDGRSDRWFQVAPQPEPPVFVSMRMASEWSDAAHPFKDCYAVARSELLGRIDSTIQTAGSGIAGFLWDHGNEFMDLIERYNDMVKNFRILNART